MPSRGITNSDGYLGEDGYWEREREREREREEMNPIILPPAMEGE